jgi:hypothetical protein
MKISKYSTFAVIFSLLTIFSQASAQTRQTKEEYIDRYKHIAIDHMERYGIPASITMAQGILESDCGNSNLARRSNNHFGIKCKKDWKGERVYHNDDAPNECFRKYDSVEEPYLDHADFLDNSPRYDSLFAYSARDYKSWARGLKAAGYATAKDYAQRLVKLIEDNKLYLLDQEDGATLYAARNSAESSINHNFSAQSSVQTPSTHKGRIDPNKYRVTERIYKGYSVYTNNRVSMLIARKEDKFADIAQAFALSERLLRKYNEIPRQSTADPILGEMIYIERKQAKWQGEQSLHTVGKGETLTSIAQLYGIRQRSLAKLNKLKHNATLTEGEQLKLK